MSYVLSYTVLAFIEFFVFLLSYLIYTRTKGASVAYKKWAIGTFILLMGGVSFLTAAVLFECNEDESSNKNELHKIIGGSIIALGYFYIPVGILYFSKDLGVINFDEKMIKKAQIIFFSVISAITVFFVILVPYFKILTIIGVTLNSLYAFVWIFAIFAYQDVYSQILKNAPTGWTLIYIGMIAAFFSEILNVLYFIAPEFEIPQLICEFLMAFGFVGGFFKIAKMVEAI